MDIQGGACIYDLDGFFNAVSEIRNSGISERVKITPNEMEYLISMDLAIKDEINGGNAWIGIVERMNPESHESLYLKFFPHYDLRKGK